MYLRVETRATCSGKSSSASESVTAARLSIWEEAAAPTIRWVPTLGVQGQNDRAKAGLHSMFQRQRSTLRS